MKRAIKRNIQRNVYYEGVIRGNKNGYAFLSRADGGKDMFIPCSSLGGAQHGDKVKARLVKGDEVEVVKVLSRGITRLSGTVVYTKQGAAVKPDMQAYYSLVYLQSSKGVKEGEKVFVEITSYLGAPVGKIVRRLGGLGEEESEILSILFDNGFSDLFPVEVEKAAEELVSVNFDGRKDLRNMLTVTVDGQDARDFDDAVSIFEENGNYVLWVHIADVSAYVREGGIIDREAYSRGTSVYFPKKAYPMLPEKLSNDLCSLREGEDKATVSVKMVFDEKGERLSAEPFVSVIRSNHRMTYDELQAIFDGEKIEKYEDVAEMLLAGRKLAAILKEKREKQGSIDFASNEGEVVFDDDEVGEVVGVAPTESNVFIEMFMIAANEAVAETLENNGYPCAYRIHEEPTREKLAQLTAFAGCFIDDMPVEPLKPAQISVFVKKCEELGEAGEIISKVAIKCMQKAKYSAENLGHYGLASDCYCHFTSPIRRYPDLMVHRALKRYISRKPYDLAAYNEKLEGKCENCSERERAAERAERDIVDYYKAVYMSDHIGEKYDGMISGVTAFAIFVTLPNGVEGSVRTDELPFDYYLDDLRFTVVAQERNFRIGDKVEVTVVNADIPARKVYFAFSDYYESGLLGKEGYIESVGNVRPLDINAFADIRPKPRKKQDLLAKKLARDHKPPKKRRR